jgi:hypothetical protein
MPDFTPRMKDLARALAVPLLGDATKEKELFKLLAPHDKEARLNRHGEPEWAVATALFHDGHQSTTTLTVGDLAVTVCQVLAANGETYELKPRAVGETLRALGLSTEKLGNEGRGLRLTRSVRHQIHQLARDMGLKRSDLLRHMTVEAGYGGLSCALCEDYGLMICEDGKRLRGIPLKRPRGSGLYART